MSEHRFEIWMDQSQTPIVLRADKLDDMTIGIFESIGWYRYTRLDTCNNWEDARDICRQLGLAGQSASNVPHISGTCGALFDLSGVL
jgi:hypothetical protein